MNTLTVIIDDQFVSVDGEGYHGVDVSKIDSSIHAIQWNRYEGEIEYKDGRKNEMIDDISEYIFIIKEWSKRKNIIINELSSTKPTPFSVWNSDTNSWDIDEVLVRKENKPNPYSVWDTKTNSWVVDNSLKSSFDWSLYQQSAQRLYDLSNSLVLEAYENSTPVSDDIKSYRNSLRLIINAQTGDPTQPLPSL